MGPHGLQGRKDAGTLTVRCGAVEGTLKSSKDRSGCHQSATFPLKEEREPWRTRAGGFRHEPPRETSRPKEGRGRIQEGERGGAGRKVGVRPEGWAPASTSVLFLFVEQGRMSVCLEKKKKDSKAVLENWSVGNFNPLCKSKGGKHGTVATAGLGTEGDHGFHAKRGARGAEELKAAGWGYDDGTISNLAPFPICRLEAAEASDLINIYTVPFYHGNANDTHWRCSRRWEARKWGAGPLSGVRPWPCDLGDYITAAGPGGQSPAGSPVPGGRELPRRGG